MKRISLAFAAAVLAAASAAPAQISVIVPESEFTAVTGFANSSLGALGVSPDGTKYAVQDYDGTSARRILLVDMTKAAGSRVSLVATDSDLLGAIDTANGSLGVPAASAVRVQGLRYNANGEIVAYLDGSGMDAYLLVISGTAPHTIRVIAGKDNAEGVQAIEGGNGMFMDGNTAYCLVNNFSGTPEDQIVSVDTTYAANDTNATQTVVVSQATMLAASLDTDATNLSLNDGAKIGPNQFVLINSGAGTSNDNLALLTTSPTVSITTYVPATEIEADLGSPTTDVGYGAVAADSAGNIILGNTFGAPTSGAGYTDDSIIRLTNVSGLTATTYVLDEPTAFGLLGGTNFFIGSDGLVYNPTTNQFVASGDGTGNSGLVSFTANTVSVSDWAMY